MNLHFETCHPEDSSSASYFCLLRKKITYSLLVLGFLLSSVSVEAVDAADTIRLRILSYNIHHAEGVDGKLDLQRIADVIGSVQPDIVALQEVDQRVARTRGVDQPAELARLTKMNVAFGGNIELQGGRYGNAILSRFPITRHENHRLPNFDNGEQRGFLVAELQISEDSEPVVLLATHLDHRSDESERIASAKAINQWASSNLTRPAILAGDLNAQPTSVPLNDLGKMWQVANKEPLATIPVDQPRKQIDFVLTRPRNRWKVVEVKVLDEAVASDHRPILAVLERTPSIVDRSAGIPISRVLFGSCIRQDQPMPILQTMLATRPQLLLMLGDNIYADTSDMAVMRSKYGQLANDAGFAKLRSACPVLATWDDHDYGTNDGGADFPKRDQAQVEFLDFWDVPKDSPRRSQQGVYEAKVFGPPGKRLQVIMLDTRYFRSPLRKGPRRTGGPYLPDSAPGKTMLGEVQWNWLEQQLQVPAEVRVIGSSIQLVAESAGQEAWSNLPHERQRFLDLIRSTHAAGVILLSGDRHWSELSMINSPTPYPLMDVTSSSLNQIHPRGTPTDNRHRAVDATYHQPNFGMLEIDWDSSDPTITIEIRDVKNQSQIHKQVRLSELQP